MLATESGDAVARAASLIGLSERHYRRRFRHWYGVAPKCYQRLLRVDRLLRQLHERPWDADEHGSNDPPFADQPHAIREFRHLTGLTPEAYRRAKRGGDATMRSVTEPMISRRPAFEGMGATEYATVPMKLKKGSQKKENKGSAAVQVH